MPKKTEKQAKKTEDAQKSAEKVEYVSPLGPLGDGRESMIDDYYESQEKAEPESETSEEKPESEPEDSDEQAAAEAEETEEAGEEDPEKEAIEFSVDEKQIIDRYKKEHGFVEAGSLHEERERRKDLSRKVREMETREVDYLKDLKNLAVEVEKLKNNRSPDEDADDNWSTPEQREIATLKREIADLKKSDKTRSQKEAEAVQVTKQRELHKIYTTVDKELEADGFPGFYFMRMAVGDELAKIFDDDPDSIEEYDNPEGWKKIYKEKIFPTVSSKFIKKQQRELVETKQQRKVKGNLVSSHGGKGENIPSKDTPWTNDDYAAWKRKQSLL